MAYPILCFYFLLFHFPSLSSSLDLFCNYHDYFALLQFKNSFSLNSFASEECTQDFHGSSYPKTTSWVNGSNCCLWDGVTCDSMSGHVIGLDLSCSWLQGQFHPNNTLFQLRHLQTLNLAHNNLKGSLISSQFGDLPALTHLNLSQSSFEGKIPPKISQLSKLVSLDFSSNLGLKLEPFTWEKLILNMTDLRELVLDNINMSSIRPSSLSSLMNLSASLVSLRLSNTWLHGNLANDIFYLEKLQHLDLSSNEQLKVQLPKSNWSSPLKYLDLSNIAFSGEVPDSIGHLKSLNFLSLKSCQFEGPIPPSFRNLTQLTYLDLASNKFSGEMSLLSHLQLLTSLILENNSFSSQIPSSLSKLEHLTELDLSSNSFSGEIPEIFGNLTQLSSFGCSKNKLVGPIPDKICKLSNLTYLDVSYNFLNGTIPHACYSSPSMQVLFLNNNQLFGLIGRFTTYSLRTCDLSNNKLQGSLPESFSNLKSLVSLSLSSNQLSGYVNFHQFSNLQYLEQLDLSNNMLLSLSFDNNVDYTIIPNLQVLQLSSCNINVIPKFLRNLQSLYFLNLSNNKIHGKVPEWFNNVGNGSLLYLDLSHNNLTSVEHLSMENLMLLDLSSNMLQGHLPIAPFGVQFFSVSNNKLSGEVSSLFCNADSLEILNLSHNNFSGLIPQCLVAFPNLLVLDLRRNNLVGTIPNNFSKSNSLQSLNLNSNLLEGRLPLSLAHCNQLNILDVGQNKIEDAFPNWLEGLPELQVLVLRDNRFYGAISSSKTKLPFSKLRIFDVSNNHFSGSLPSAYIKEFKGMMKTNDAAVGLQYIENKNYSSYKYSVMVTWKGNVIDLQRILIAFTTIDLSNNTFDGEIPKAIGELCSLIGLNMSHNRISGFIPKSMGNLKNLEWLDLSANKLTGEIPLALTNLNFLSVLNLSQNQLQGIIPTGKQFNTFQNDSYEGNPGLCGVPMSKPCIKDKGEMPQLSSSEDGKFGFGWKPIALGYGCGTVFGMVMGYIVLSFGKPRRLARIFEGQPKKHAKGTRIKNHTNRRRMN